MPNTADPTAIFLGIDIGNTKTAMIAADRYGTVVDYRVGPGTNHQDLGAIETRRRVSNGYREVVSTLGCEPAGIFVGAAGADTRSDFDALHGVFSDVFRDVPFAFENDGLIALMNGAEGRPGIVVTCGTGNTNFAMDGAGHVRRIGGLSHHLGDRMGAHAIAHATTAAAVRADDGRGMPSVLLELLNDAFAVQRPADLIDRPVDAPMVQRVIETLFAAASAGDGVALEIVWTFVKEIVVIVERFVCDMFSPGEPFRLVLDGPVYAAGYEVFITMIRNAVLPRYPAEIVIPHTPPVVGALYAALERAGVALTPVLIGNVKESLRGKVAQT